MTEQTNEVARMVTHDILKAVAGKSAETAAGPIVRLYVPGKRGGYIEVTYEPSGRLIIRGNDNAGSGCLIVIPESANTVAVELADHGLRPVQDNGLDRRVARHKEIADRGGFDITRGHKTKARTP